MQAVATFGATLKALTDAGVEVVKFDMGLLIAEGGEMEAQLLVAYEAPRELARCAPHSLTHSLSHPPTHPFTQAATWHTHMHPTQ